MLPAVLELHLRGRVRPGRHDDLVEILREAVPFYEAPGGIRVRLLWDVANRDQFIEIVEYADQATYDRDQQRVAVDSQMKQYLDRWRALLVGPPQVETYLVSNKPADPEPRVLADGGTV